MADAKTGLAIDGRHARSQSTRERILLAAERLFAELGIANVSLRDVGVAAGQKDNGAVQYHFGDRDNLIVEIVEYRGRFIDHVRRELLDRIMSPDRLPKVRDFVDAFVLSLASSLDEGPHFLRFLSRLVIERGSIPSNAIPEEEVDLLRRRMLAMLPHLSEDIVDERWTMLMSSTIHLLASYQGAMQSGGHSAPLSHRLEELASFLTAGLEAAAPSEPDRYRGFVGERLAGI